MGSIEKTQRGFRFTLEGSSAFLLDAEAHTDKVSEPHLIAFSDQRFVVHASERASFIRGVLMLWSQAKKATLLPSSEGMFDSEEGGPLDRGSVDLGEGCAFEFDAETQLAELVTSGSTGKPAIFPKTARQILGEALVLSELLSLSSEDVILATTASHHLYGLLFGVLAPLSVGAKIVASPGNEPGVFHPEKIADLVRRYQVTRLVSVPAHLRALLEAPIKLPSVTTIVSSASPLQSEIARALEEKFGVHVIDVLGSTETGGVATRRPAASEHWIPIPGVEVSLSDDDHLMISSPFLENPHIPERSDERARLHPDGSFEYLGRIDGIVKVGGKRVSLREVELAVERLAGVKDCVCISRPTPGLRGEELLLLVATDSLEKKDIVAALRKELTPIAVPRKVRLLPSLPRDERGKLKRDEVLAVFERPDHAPKLVEVESTLPSDWVRFSGHFDEDPILPALSQLSDIVLPEIRKAFGGGALASLRRVKWTRPLRPGATLRLRLEKKPSSVFFELREGSILACSGTITLYPQEP